MKKTLVSVALLALSITANATSNSSVTMSNFSVSTIIGLGSISSIPGSFNANVYATAYAYFNNITDSDFGSSLPLSASATNGDSFSVAFANIDGSITSTSSAKDGFGASTATTYIDYAYQKNTLLLFSADASLTGAVNSSSDSAYSTATLGLYTANTSGIFNNAYTISSNTYADTSNTNSYSGSKSLYFYFYDNQDRTIRLSAQVNSYSVGVSTVDEAESYAMLIAGISLMGAIVRRNKSSRAV